ncbi:hypothetical protein DW976_01620 [Lachnospira eligens]|nr:hypothetical protein DW976_01620 [Lachnospira eligens]
MSAFITKACNNSCAVTGSSYVLIKFWQISRCCYRKCTMSYVAGN